MGAKIGRLITCERCSKTLFLEQIGYDYTDGGYTKYAKYEPLPDEWDYTTQIGYLCPECRAEYNRLKTEFLKGANNGN